MEETALEGRFFKALRAVDAFGRYGSEEAFGLELRLEDVRYQVGEDVHIAGASAELDAGSMNVLLGPTLAGKTTLLRLMAGLDKPTSGRILLDGRDVTSIPVRKRSVAMVYQQFVNYPTLSVYENIASPLRVARLPRDEVERRVEKAAGLLGLKPMLKRTPLELSGGQQQRVAIARALVKQADLVLLDEPLANLDYKLREELREELPRLFSATGSILVYATTEPSEALLLGGRTLTLWEGGISQIGPTAEVYRRPASLAAARVFSDPPLNELPVSREGPVLRALDRTMAVPAALADLADGPYRLGFRAEDVHIVDAPSDDMMSFAGKVTVTEITGSESFVHVDVGPESWVSVLRGVHEIEPGFPVEVAINPSRAFVFDETEKLAAGPALKRAA
jgi:glycerol transport system ATP-binding protein